MPSIISVAGVSKTYASGFRALDRIDLEIRQGEIFALLRPNGAGKTTLIGLVCGIVELDQGTVSIAGLDIGADYRAVRAMIGLVPQELTTACWHRMPSCARWWCRKGPSRRRKSHNWPNARRTVRTTGRCG